MVKNKFFNVDNIVLSFKGMATSIIAGGIALVPAWIGNWFMGVKEMMYIGRFFQIVGFLLFLFSWGYFANKFWGWK